MKAFGVSTHLYHAVRLEQSHLAEIAGSGFSAVELFATRSHVDYHDAATIGRLADWLRETGVRLHSVHAPIFDALVNGGWGRAYSIAIKDERERRAAVDEALAAADIAQQIPFRFLVLHLGIPKAQKPAGGDNDHGSLLHSLEEIAAHARPLGVTLALEVMDNPLSTPEALVALIEQDLDGLDAGICLDAGHAFMLGDLGDAIETVSGHLVTTHLHDNHRRSDDHLVPFEGAIDWGAAIMSLEKIGYDGMFMFEVKNADGAARVLERSVRARKRMEALADSSALPIESFL